MITTNLQTIDVGDKTLGGAPLMVAAPAKILIHQ
jgi:hypothetical protein